MEKINQVKVYMNGIVYTVNRKLGEWWKQPEQAFATDGNIIVFVGSNDGVKRFVTENAEVIDLRGAVVLPGIHDVHVHPLEARSPVEGTVALPADTDPERMVSIIRKQSSKQIGTTWIMGHGYSLYNMLQHIKKGKRPPKAILDEALGDIPGIMMEETSHSVWVNSKALELAGITKDTPNIPGGIIMKDPKTREPNGILLENAGNSIVDFALRPTAEIEQLDYEGLVSSLGYLSENGITSICDARVYWQRNHHRAWLRAESEGKLTVRAVLGLWAYPHLDDDYQIPELQKMFSHNPDRRLRLSQIKLYSDGLLESTTAAVLGQYKKRYNFETLEDNTGMNYFTQERLECYLRKLQHLDNGGGFDFHIHTIGDRAVRESLNAIEKAKPDQNPERPSRHRLTHVEMVSPDDIRRFRDLDVTADFQVSGDFTLPKHRADNEDLISKVKARETVPVRSVWETGARVTLSSDWDVSQLNPFRGIMHAAQRGHQAVSVHTAVEMYTINAAYVMRQEDRVGSLEVGKEADFIVIDQDIFNIPVADIVKTKVLLTAVEGRSSYRSKRF